jgi:hypothetical protein
MLTSQNHTTIVIGKELNQKNCAISVELMVFYLSVRYLVGQRVLDNSMRRSDRRT